MPYIPRKTVEILAEMPDFPFQVKDLKERLNGGTLRRLNDAGLIEKSGKRTGKLITWRLTDKGMRYRSKA